MHQDEFLTKPTEVSETIKPEPVEDLTKLSHKEFSQRLADAMLKNLNNKTRNLPD